MGIKGESVRGGKGRRGTEKGKGRGKDTTPDHSMGGEGTVLFSL